MLGRSFLGKDRVGKLQKPQKRSFREHVKQKMVDSLGSPPLASYAPSVDRDVHVGNHLRRSTSPALASPIITVVVGPEKRLFAAHEDVLSHSPRLAAALRDSFFDSGSDRRILLPDEEPEIFSCILEYLYKGDYSPRLVHDRRGDTWHLEDDATLHENSPKIGGRGSTGTATSSAGQRSAFATIFHSGVGDVILRDTAVYCAADSYGLDELKRLALKKQGLQCGIEVSTILRSARYAYARTPDTDSRLRAHYLALIIRSRKTFKRSGTMQMEMEAGGTKLFFDLFVAMCNHMDDLEVLSSPNYGMKGTPRTI
jgi:hypothetical protein